MLPIRNRENKIPCLFWPAHTTLSWLSLWKLSLFWERIWSAPPRELSREHRLFGNRRTFELGRTPGITENPRLLRCGIVDQLNGETKVRRKICRTKKLRKKKTVFRERGFSGGQRFWKEIHLFHSTKSRYGKHQKADRDNPFHHRLPFLMLLIITLLVFSYYIRL